MIILRHIILIIIISALPSLVQAATVTAGSACHSITPSQATKFEWRTEGLRMGTQECWWVNCPSTDPLEPTNWSEPGFYKESNRLLRMQLQRNVRGWPTASSPVSANIG